VAFFRELNGIVEQIENDLLQTTLVRGCGSNIVGNVELHT
jgi:hypothetical protein